MTKPFIYIAALRRSGSNLLSEALTLPPVSYILREPGFSRGKFAVKPNDAAHFAQSGIDLNGFHERLMKNVVVQKGSRRKGNTAADMFIDELLPQLRQASGQVGIKEISHRNWIRYLERLPDVRIILLGRDPRDIYLSLVQKSRERTVRWRGPMSPESVAADLFRHFESQRQMHQQCECLRVRYEDLCDGPTELERIKRFIDSDIADVGIIGGLNRHNAKVHGETITTASVRRWSREADPALRSQAKRVFELMEEYNRFWSYLDE
jgi:hypothetical protein